MHIFRGLILACLALLGHCCTSVGSNKFTLTIDNVSSTLNTVDFICNSTDWFSLISTAPNTLVKPVSFFTFGDPIQFTVTRYDWSTACDKYGVGDYKCGLACPLHKAGTCKEVTVSTTPYCFATFPVKKKTYNAYPLIMEDAVSLTSYWVASSPPFGGSRVFETGTNRSVSLNNGQYDSTIMMVDAASDFDPSDYYYVPNNPWSWNRFLSFENIEWIESSLTPVVVNGRNFDCKTEPLSIDYGKDWEDLDTDLPFEVLAVVGPSPYTYTVNDILKGFLNAYTTEGMTVFNDGYAAFWDPCNFDFFEIEVKPQDKSFTIRTSYDWTGDTVCVITMNELDNSQAYLNEWSKSQSAFIPSTRWTGAVSLDLIDTYKIRATADMTTSPTPTNIEYQFSSKGTNPPVLNLAMKGGATNNCTFELNDDDVVVPTWGGPSNALAATITLTNYLPLNPKIRYCCGFTCMYILTPTYLRDSETELDLKEEDYIILPLPVLDFTYVEINIDTAEKQSLKEMLQDFSGTASANRAIIVVLTILGTIGIMMLSIIAMKRLGFHVSVTKEAKQVTYRANPKKGFRFRLPSSPNSKLKLGSPPVSSPTSVNNFV